LDQRCTDNICKSWDHKSLHFYNEKIPIYCTECWHYTDITESFDIFPNKDKFTDLNEAKEILDDGEPYKLNHKNLGEDSLLKTAAQYKTGSCDIQCKQGYWSSNSNANKFYSHDMYSQKCISNICKDGFWEKADKVSKCSSCFEKADFSDFDNFPGKSTISQHKLVN